MDPGKFLRHEIGQLDIRRYILEKIKLQLEKVQHPAHQVS